MKKHVFVAGVMGSIMLMGSALCHAETWVKNGTEANKVVEAVYYDVHSIAAQKKSVLWTEKYVFTPQSSKFNTNHLAQYPACKKGIAKNGDVTYAKMDFEMVSGKYRNTAIRNYTKDNKLVCSNKDMKDEMDNSWQEVKRGTPMYDMYYTFVSKFQMGNILE
jgi:hypothetical protein